MIFEFGRYVIDVALEKTKLFIIAIFLLERMKLVRAICVSAFRAPSCLAQARFCFFLHKLGIDPQKAGEVFGVSDKEKHTNHYSGWYHIVGELLKGKVDWKNYDDSNAFFPDANSDFRVWFENDPNRMGWIEKDFPTPMLELSFAAVLPAQK